MKLLVRFLLMTTCAIALGLALGHGLEYVLDNLCGAAR